MSESTFVIVGAGLAGAKAAEALRERGFEGRLVLIGDEPHRPYERPPLSKGYLMGSAERDSVFVHDAGWYAEHDVELRTDTRVTALDRAAHEVVLADGSRIGYAKLLLATGSRPRPFPDADGALYLRRLDDSDRLREVLAAGGRLVLVGGGWIGLEAAAAARQAGLDVTVVEPLELPLLRVLGPEVARVFADLHTAHGVDLRLGTSVDAVGGGSVRLEGGEVIEADAVLVGIGAIPNVELAEESGLSVSNGVDVDAGLRTSDPDVFAVGDIAAVLHPVLGRRIRVEHWANALNQPTIAAANMLGGDETYARLPYFFTDQYDLGMEYVGDGSDADEVVLRGDVAGREFVAFWLRDGRVRAGMNVNVWDVGDDVKALIASDLPVDTTRLADSSVPLAEVLPGA